MNQKIQFIVLLFNLTLFCGCNNLIRKEGYILFNNSNYFQFVPAKQLNLESSLSSFNTNNLENGIMFSSESIGTLYDTIFSYVDTFHLDNISRDLGQRFQYLKIVPVYIEYFNKNNNDINDNYSEWKYFVRGKSVKVKVLYGDYLIIKIRPFRCKALNIKGSYYEDSEITPRP
jgi:hypothetical protein